VDALLRFNGAVKRDEAVDTWLDSRVSELGAIARVWFDRMRVCGPDVRELMHDGLATACVADAPFAYVGVFKAHVNVGFFLGSELPDPTGLLEGTGKRLRHVKLRPDAEIDADALSALIDAAYAYIKLRLETDGP
jgi:hypothetical protein